MKTFLLRKYDLDTDSNKTIKVLNDCLDVGEALKHYSKIYPFDSIFIETCERLGITHPKYNGQTSSKEDALERIAEFEADRDDLNAKISGFDCARDKLAACAAIGQYNEAINLLKLKWSV